MMPRKAIVKNKQLELGLPHPVFITDGYSEKLLLAELIKLDSANNFLITDYNVNRLFVVNFLDFLRRHGINIVLLPVSPGEKSKTIEIFVRLLKELYKHKVSRYDSLIGLGGGMVLNLSGFLASTVCRGINLFYIPTTVLAQADVCIGSKAGLNFEGIKNLVGTFYNPKAVIIDFKYIEKLPPPEKFSGLCECVKHALIKDVGMFRFIMQQSPQDLLKSCVLKQIILRVLRSKALLLNKDWEEEDFGALLRYGHTIGGALEHLTKNKMKHSHAISMGMVAAAEIANELGFLATTDVEKHREILKKIQMPTTIPAIFRPNSILSSLEHDKYRKHGKNYFVLLSTIGKPKAINRHYRIPLENKIIREALSRCY